MLPAGARRLPVRSPRLCFTPKDVVPFELGPFSGPVDARFVEWLGEESGGGTRVHVRRGWKDLVGLILGFGWPWMFIGACHALFRPFCLSAYYTTVDIREKWGERSYFVESDPAGSSPRYNKYKIGP